MVINEVFPEDAGTFTCVAKNCVGFASSSAELVVERPLSDHGLESVNKHDRRSLSRESSLADIVEGIPPTFAQRPQTKTAESGSTCELECRFVAIPEAEVKWYHNKKEIRDGDNSRVSVVHQADMHMYCSIVRIEDATAEDEGTYEVVAKNREGEAINTLVLKVLPRKSKEDRDSKEAPMIVKPLTPTVCKIGDTVKMETVITGTPKPTLKWTKNGEDLSKAKNVNIIERDNVFTLIVEQVTQKDDGDYTVKAENDVGSAQTSANICVQGIFDFKLYLDNLIM